MSTNLEHRARETQRNRESRRQASEAQREKGRQREMIVVVQNNSKEMYKKNVLHVQSCFFANYTYCCFSPFSGVAFAA